MEFKTLDDLVLDVQMNGYYGGIRLIKAAIKRFHDHCRQHGIHLDRRNFTIEYSTDIPVRVGLAGSSAIVTSTIRALMSFYGVEVPRPIQPNLILSVELEELGIGAGLQDRVIQVYEGVVFMDFDQAHMKQNGFGLYEPLDPATLPPLFVAYRDTLAEGTEVTHNDLRSRFNRGDPEVLAAMNEFAGLAQEARDLLVAGKGNRIGPLMDANFDLRARICRIGDGNRQLVLTGRQLGAAVKFAGSGGAVIGTYDGDPQRLERLRQAYADVGALVIVPQILPAVPTSPVGADVN
jgi:glucuronokinase